MDSIEDFQIIDSKLFIDKFNDNIESDFHFFPSIPNITLEYSESNIMLNSICANRHKIIIPINEFLIKFHPLYKDYLNFDYCNKCMLKLFYHEKSIMNFNTNYCQNCDKFLCFHSKNHPHELKIIIKEFNIVKDFIFPICPYCKNGKQKSFCDKINELKLNKKYLKRIIDNFIENKQNLYEIEKDFRNIIGKYYIDLFPYYEYYMRMNFLECLLCETLLETYNIMKNKKEMYFQIIKNIENIFHFISHKFILGKINGDKVEIESLKNHFKNINNCFLNQKNQSLNIIENSSKYFRSLILSSNNYNKFSLDYITYLPNKIYFFPEIKKLFHLSKNTLSIYDFKELKIGKKIFLNNIPFNILYIKKNLFIFQYIDKFELYSFHDDDTYAEFKIIITLLMETKIKLYSKIITTKDKKFICFLPNSIDFYSFIPSKNINLIFIKSISGIYFMKQINENLILFSYEYYFIFYNENGEEIQKIDLKGETCLNEKQLCIYKNIFIFIISSNHQNIILININNFQIIKNTYFLNRLTQIKELKNENIVDNNNKLANLSIGIFSKTYRLEKFNPIAIKHNDGIIIYNHRNYFFFLKNIEKINTSPENFNINIIFYNKKSKNFPLFSDIFMIDEKNYLICHAIQGNGVSINSLSFD